MVTSTADGPLNPAQEVAAAVAKCEELAAVADELREALADLVAAVGYHPAAAHTGLAVGTLQLWVTRVPPSKTLDAARQRCNS
ncbi:hypothetical protein [Candidatus Poriferisocius sp.]|uniref:hypothetical protein n=1 Tax=Candidatus Poriferisocius sp. TaxID=3101276 RepID=UPI003B58BFE9